jgi:hypothetical protein
VLKVVVMAVVVVNVESLIIQKKSKTHFKLKVKMHKNKQFSALLTLNISVQISCAVRSATAANIRVAIAGHITLRIVESENIAC